MKTKIERFTKSQLQCHLRMISPLTKSSFSLNKSLKAWSVPLHRPSFLQGGELCLFYCVCTGHSLGLLCGKHYVGNHYVGNCCLLRGLSPWKRWNHHLQRSPCPFYRSSLRRGHCRGGGMWLLCVRHYGCEVLLSSQNMV